MCILQLFAFTLPNCTDYETKINNLYGEFGVLNANIENEVLDYETMLTEQFTHLQATFTGVTADVWKHYDAQLIDAIENSRNSADSLLSIFSNTSAADIETYQKAQAKLKASKAKMLELVQDTCMFHDTLEFLYQNYGPNTFQAMTMVKEFCQAMVIDMARSIAIYDHNLNRAVVKANLAGGNYYNRLFKLDTSNVQSELKEIINSIRIDPLMSATVARDLAIDVGGNQALWLFEVKRKEFQRYVDRFQESIDKRVKGRIPFTTESFLGRISTRLHDISMASLKIKHSFKVNFTEEMTAAVPPYEKSHVLKCMEEFMKRKFDGIQDLSTDVLAEKIIFKFGLACRWYT